MAAMLFSDVDNASRQGIAAMGRSYEKRSGPGVGSQVARAASQSWIAPGTSFCARPET
jgi:Xaa-Pro aminopeptidase